MRKALISLVIGAMILWLAGCGYSSAAPNAGPSSTPPATPPPVEPIYPEGPAYYEPPAAASGTGQVFDIGPADYGNPTRTYRELADFPWLDLAPGDLVLIHHRTEPYRGFIFVRTVATEAAPVKIYGVASPAGELPVISGENAVMDQELYDFLSYRELLGLGLITVRGEWNDKARHIVFANLDVRDASIGNNYGYEDSSGASHQFPWIRGCGFWIKGGNVSVLGCKVHNNNEGIFTQANANLIDDITSDLLVQGCHVYFNGTLPGSFYPNGDLISNDLDHNLYLQGAGAVVEFCRIGLMRPTAGGSALKDRCSGSIIRYNLIESGARILDLVEPEDTQDIVVDQTTYVYGNILIDDYANPVDVPKASALVHYGFDNDPGENRRGVLYFYGNTVFVRVSRDGAAGNWRTKFFEIGREDADVPHDPVEMYNNIIHVIPTNAGDDPTFFNLLSVYGDIRMGGGNWITDWDSDHCRVIDAGGYPYVAEGDPIPVWGTMTILNAGQPILTGSDPSFTATTLNAYDLSLTPTSTLRGSALPLPAYVPPIQYQYRDGMIRTPRTSTTCPGALE